MTTVDIDKILLRKLNTIFEALTGKTINITFNQDQGCYITDASYGTCILNIDPNFPPVVTSEDFSTIAKHEWSHELFGSSAAKRVAWCKKIIEDYESKNITITYSSLDSLAQIVDDHRCENNYCLIWKGARRKFDRLLPNMINVRTSILSGIALCARTKRKDLISPEYYHIYDECNKALDEVVGKTYDAVLVVCTDLVRKWIDNIKVLTRKNLSDLIDDNDIKLFNNTLGSQHIVENDLGALNDNKSDINDILNSISSAFDNVVENIKKDDNESYNKDDSVLTVENKVISIDELYNGIEQVTTITEEMVMEELNNILIDSGTTTEEKEQMTNNKTSVGTIGYEKEDVEFLINIDKIDDNLRYSKEEFDRKIEEIKRKIKEINNDDEHERKYMPMFDIVTDSANNLLSDITFVEPYESYIELNSLFKNIQLRTRRDNELDYSGREIDMRAYINYKATKYNPKVFKRSSIKSDFSISVLLDCSASMSGWKMNCLKKICQTLLLSLKSINGIDLSVYAFSGSVNHNDEKGFTYVTEIDSNDKLNQLSCSGNTHTSDALKYVTTLPRYVRNKKLMIVVTDGQPWTSVAGIDINNKPVKGESVTEIEYNTYDAILQARESGWYVITIFLSDLSDDNEQAMARLLWMFGDPFMVSHNESELKDTLLNFFRDSVCGYIKR